MDHKMGQGIRYASKLIENVTDFLVSSYDEDAKSRQRTCSSFAFSEPRISSCMQWESISYQSISLAAWLALCVRASIQEAKCRPRSG